MSLVQRGDEYVIVGEIVGRGGSSGRAGIVRLNLRGNTLGYDLYGEEHTQVNPYVDCASPAIGGGFIIGGHFGVNRQGWIVKTDAEGVMVWDETPQFGEGYTVIDAISHTEDGGYVFAASAQESKSVSSETKFFTWVGKISGLGTLMSQIYFSGSSNPRSIMQTADGGYVFVGTWRLNDVGNREIWLVKLSSEIIPSEDLPPSVLILSPENKLYPLGNISQTYFVDETVARVEYSLDGQANVSLGGNTTIIGLPAGEHTLRVYAYDGFADMETAQVNFTVGEPFPTVLIIEIAVLIIIVAIASYILGVKMHERKLRKTS